MVKPVKINKNGRAEVEIKMDSSVYEAARGLLSEVDTDILDRLGYEYENYVVGEGFDFLLELGMVYYLANKSTLEEDLKNAKIKILNELPNITEKEILMLKRRVKAENKQSNHSGRPVKSDRDKIRIVVEIIGELGEEYDGRAPQNILVTEMSDRYNMSEFKVKELINILKRKGIIYEPQVGYLKIN